jgi:ribosomal protein S18 acetylase RimI-like enzyme
MINVVNYDSSHHPEFRRMNMEWLEKYGLLESHDLEILNDPQGTVIDRGGCIFIAMDGANMVGTAGLWKETDKEYELIKMAVVPGYRGQGLGKMLLDKCIEEARKRNAEKVFLFSNSQLTTALSLYEKYGFRHVEVTDAPFQTADVKMELILKPK